MHKIGPQGSVIEQGEESVPIAGQTLLRNQVLAPRREKLVRDATDAVYLRQTSEKRS